LPQLLGEQTKRCLQQGKFVGRIHRAGDIQQEDQVRRWKIFRGYAFTLKSDVYQFMRVIPRCPRNLRDDLERMISGRLGIVIIKVIDHLLNAYCILWRTLPVVDKSPDVTVRCSVDIYRKG